MKALSVSPPYAALIAEGTKTVECRSWSAQYRGDLLICATKDKDWQSILPIGQALCIVRLADIKPYDPSMYQAAQVDQDFSGGYAWILEDVRPIKPIPVKGQQRIFNLNICPQMLDISPKDINNWLVKNNYIQEI